MPELPEVETIARELEAQVTGATIEEVRITRPDVIREVSPRAFAKHLAGVRIERCWRRAKFAVIDLSSGERICVQPRFTGALIVESRQRPLSAHNRHYSTLSMRLADRRSLHYVDVRRLGTVALMNEKRFVRFMNALGAEPLAPEFTPSLFSGLLRDSDQAIKKLIMNQAKIAGVGNIYANEALWSAGIDPSKPGSLVSAASAKKLHREIVDVLRAAVESRGTSFRDYRDANGEQGEFFSRLNAYGRAGLPCNRCGKKLVGTHAIDGRATVFCPHCQR